MKLLEIFKASTYNNIECFICKLANFTEARKNCLFGLNSGIFLTTAVISRLQSFLTKPIFSLNSIHVNFDIGNSQQVLSRPPICNSEIEY